MLQVNIEEAQFQLPDLINAVLKGEEVFIRKDESNGIRLVPIHTQRPIPLYGSARNLIDMDNDFDDPVVDFHEYSS